MFFLFRFPYRAPLLLLHWRHAGTRLSSELMPGCVWSHLSISIRWSAVLASFVLHQWHGGLSCSISLRLRLNSVAFRVCCFSVWLPSFDAGFVLCVRRLFVMWFKVSAFLCVCVCYLYLEWYIPPLDCHHSSTHICILLLDLVSLHRSSTRACRVSHTSLHWCKPCP